VPEVPAHQKVLVHPSFLDDVNHGRAACNACHGGDPAGTTRALAHVGMKGDPTVANATTGCRCHAATVAKSQASLHVTLAGIRNSLVRRSGGGTLCPELQTSFQNHCSRCHSSCGDCHVSVPGSAGGGLLDGHRFRKTPSMGLVCTACHGSRVGDEYRGLNAGVPADTHYNRGLQCTACHTGTEMHGAGSDGAPHRTKAAEQARCETCHPDDARFRGTTAHMMHRGGGRLKLSCQVCHAVEYKNCSSCHVRLENGMPVYEVNAPSHLSLITFKIGRNPAPDALHPQKWVPVRHVPADPDDHAYYGADLLQSFDAVPTWRFAAPHNIQRRTPQNQGCRSTCHGQRALYLAPADLAAYELDANTHVVVPDDLLPR